MTHRTLKKITKKLIPIKSRIILFIYSLLTALQFSLCLEKSYLDSYLEESGKLKILEKCKRIECQCLDAFSMIQISCPLVEVNKCFENGLCRKQLNGFCGYDYTKPLRDCLNKAKYCRIGGWYNELCLKNQGKMMYGPHIIKPEHICYRDAICEVQIDGECRWRQTTKLMKCLQKFLK